MGREIENPRIQIWKASKSIFHRLGEQDPESEEERPGPGSHGQGLSPVWLCIAAWPPRAQEPNPVPPPFLPPPRDPQRPAAQPDTTRQLGCSQMPRGSSGVALGSSATLGGGGRGRVPELGSGRRPHSLLESGTVCLTARRLAACLQPWVMAVPTSLQSRAE